MKKEMKIEVEQAKNLLDHVASSETNVLMPLFLCFLFI